MLAGAICTVYMTCHVYSTLVTGAVENKKLIKPLSTHNRIFYISCIPYNLNLAFLCLECYFVVACLL